MGYGVVKNLEKLPTSFMDGPLLAYRPFRFVGRRRRLRRVANSKVNYVFAVSLVKKFELVKRRRYTLQSRRCLLPPSPPLISQECKAVNDPQT